MKQRMLTILSKSHQLASAFFMHHWTPTEGRLFQYPLPITSMYQTLLVRHNE